MKYEIVWQPVAEDELAAIWLTSSDRDSVTKAAQWCDSEL